MKFSDRPSDTSDSSEVCLSVSYAFRSNSSMLGPSSEILIRSGVGLTGLDYELEGIPRIFCLDSRVEVFLGSFAQVS